MRALWDRLLNHRRLVWVGLLAATAVFAYFALQVRPDFAVEYLFPERSEIKNNYDRFKGIYPKDDGRALVLVEARSPEGLWSPSGVRALSQLEDALEEIPGVAAVDGPLSTKDVIEVDGDVFVGPLLPSLDLTPAEIHRRRDRATSDPILRWHMTPPSGELITIRVTLANEVAADDARRGDFTRALRRVEEAQERAGVLRITLAGLPVIRSQYTEMIAGDQGITSPLALLVILVLLWVTFRSVRIALAALATIAFSIVWTRGVMGLLGYPEQILTSVTPIVVMIVSISDTVHIVAHYRQRHGAGATCHEAIVDALEDSAWPCFLTEVTIAAGFLSLWFINIRMISQFGVATAGGMILTWLANMTVLPLMLHLVRPPPGKSGATGAERALGRVTEAFAGLVTRRPGRVVVASVGVVVAALVAGTQIKTVYYSFDDLRDSSPIHRQVALSEACYGGNTPLVLFIEPLTGAPAEAPMLEPEAVKLMERLAVLLEQTFPHEVKNAVSAADFVRKAHRVLAGAEAAAAGPYPDSRDLIAQELEVIDDGRILDDYLDFERRTAAVWAMMPDVGSHRVQGILDELEPLLRAEEGRMAARGLPVRITPTSMFAIAADVFRTIVGGLLASLGVAVLVSLMVFSLVLRSWRLGLVALVPNLLPLAIIFGFMGVTGINLTPTTVIVFSITLVIADDDTIQYLARFRTRFLREQAAGTPDPHRVATVATLRHSGPPMLVTTIAISLGFLALTASQFLGLAKFGVLIGVSLLTAVLADLLLTPIMLIAIKPRIAGPRRQPPRGERS